MRNRVVYLTLCAMLFALCSSAEAQQPKKISRIAFISPSSPKAARQNLEAFRSGLHDLGYVEGQNVSIETRWAEGSAERFPELIAELARLKMDVLVVGGAAGALAAKNSRTTTPVIFTAVTDPLGYGLIDNLARPGGNITGVALGLGEGFSGKWIELLKETVPTITAMAVLRNPTHPLADTFMRETRAAGQVLHVKLDFFEARDPNEFGSALSRMEKERARALAVTPSPLFSSERSRIVEFTTRLRLPSIFFAKDFVDIGGLLSYGPSFSDAYRRAALYVDKILKGAKPADLPVEQPTKFELIVNLKTAKQIGVTVPQSVLYRADKVNR